MSRKFRRARQHLLQLLLRFRVRLFHHPLARSGLGIKYLDTTPPTILPCGADFNGDNVVDFFDYLDFVQAFSSNDPSADFNNDDVIDFFDYLDFVQAFSSGC